MKTRGRGVGPHDEDHEVLDAAECLGLLGAHTSDGWPFGGPAWPIILPVNYVFEEPDVVFGTAPGVKLEFAPMTAVAFETDEADQEASEAGASSSRVRRSTSPKDRMVTLHRCGPPPSPRGRRAGGTIG